MAEFKLVISDPKAKRAYQVEVKSPDADRIVGLKIGEIVHGEAINLSGFDFQITGGSDKQGFPMRKDISGPKRIRALIGSGPGIRPKKKGERLRKSVRGNQISEDCSQINLKVVKHGEKDLGTVLGKAPAEEKLKGEAKGAKAQEAGKA